MDPTAQALDLPAVTSLQRGAVLIGRAWLVVARSHLVRSPVVGSRPEMRCAQCGCMDQEAPGWIAVLGSDPDDDVAPKEVFAFCPPCAAREFRMARRIAETYV